MTSTRRPLITTVPEMPSSEVAETMLSEDRMNSSAVMMTLPPRPSIACAITRLWWIDPDVAAIAGLAFDRGQDPAVNEIEKIAQVQGDVAAVGGRGLGLGGDGRTVVHQEARLPRR